MGLDLVGVVSPSLLILLEHFQKLHISAARQQKVPRGFLCSFVAGRGKEIKGFGSVSLTVWCNFVVYRGILSIFCGLGCSKTSGTVESFKELQSACIESCRRESCLISF